jgi:hypothetical protein
MPGGACGPVAITIACVPSRLWKVELRAYGTVAVMMACVPSDNVAR